MELAAAAPFESLLKLSKPAEVAPRLWMGGRHPEPTRESFDSVLSLGYPTSEIPGINGIEWIIADRERQPPAEGLAQAVEWVLGEWRLGKRVLVRCEAGLNRSGLIVGLVLIASGRQPFDALAAIRRARGPYALHNATYVRMLLGARSPQPRWGESAAGILFRDGNRFLLLERSWRCFDPRTWALPGGAVNPGEAAWDAAVREAREEIGWNASHLTPAATHTHRDPGGWTYTTFTVNSEPPVRLNGEHTDYRWITSRQAATLPLQPNLAEAWHSLTGGPNEAWRAFDVNEGELISPLLGRARTDGSQGKYVAFCKADHLAPTATCTCGLYAIDELSTLQQWWVHYRLGRMPSLWPISGHGAVARVSLEGRILPGSPTCKDLVGTWRAERVSIIGPVYLSPAYHHHAPAMKERYGVEVITNPTLECMHATIADLPAWLIAGRPGRS